MDLQGVTQEVLEHYVTGQLEIQHSSNEAPLYQAAIVEIGMVDENTFKIRFAWLARKDRVNDRWVNYQNLGYVLNLWFDPGDDTTYCSIEETEDGCLKIQMHFRDDSTTLTFFPPGHERNIDPAEVEGLVLSTAK